MTSSNTVNQKSNYRADIDGLRAIAVIAVIANHFNSDLLPNGYLGVDIFFLISGFVITSSLLGRQTEKFTSFLSGFYERRIRRLIPALLFFILISSILICLVNPDPKAILSTGQKAIFGISNITLYRGSWDYFALSTELNIFAHTWSLGVEEQFYFIYPLIFWFTGIGRNTKNGQRNFIFLIITFTILSLVTFIYLYPVNQPAAYFLMPSRFWEMSTGCILYIIIKDNYININKLKRFPSSLFILLIFTIMFLPKHYAVFSTISIILISSLLIASINTDKISYQLLTNKYLVHIGIISYSLYLWHWAILSISRWTIGINSQTIVFQLFLIYLFSLFSYKFIETPFRLNNYLINNNKRESFIVTLFIMVISFLNISIIQKKPITYLFKNFKQKIDNIVPYTYPESKAALENLYCQHPTNSLTAFEDCLNFDKPQINNQDNIYLVGDSHAANHYFSIKAALPDIPFSNVLFLHDIGFTRNIELNQNCGIVDSCIDDSWNKLLENFSQHLNNKDIVLFSWARDRIVNTSDKSLPRSPDYNKVSRLESKLSQLVELSANKGFTLVLVDDIPKPCTYSVNFNFDVMINRHGKVEMCQVSELVSILDRKPMTTLYKRLSNSSSNVFYADFHKTLCKEGYCGVLDNKGKILLSDPSPHFRTDNSIPLKDDWVKFLSKLSSQL